MQGILQNVVRTWSSTVEGYVYWEPERLQDQPYQSGYESESSEWLIQSFIYDSCPTLSEDTLFKVLSWDLPWTSSPYCNVTKGLNNKRHIIICIYDVCFGAIPDTES